MAEGRPIIFVVLLFFPCPVDDFITKTTRKVSNCTDVLFTALVTTYLWIKMWIKGSDSVLFFSFFFFLFNSSVIFMYFVVDQFYISLTDTHAGNYKSLLHLYQTVTIVGFQYKGNNMQISLIIWGFKNGLKSDFGSNIVA